MYGRTYLGMGVGGTRLLERDCIRQGQYNGAEDLLRKVLLLLIWSVESYGISQYERLLVLSGTRPPSRALSN